MEICIPELHKDRWEPKLEAVMRLLMQPDGEVVTASVRWTDQSGEQREVEISGDKRAIAAIVANSTIK